MMSDFVKVFTVIGMFWMYLRAWCSHRVRDSSGAPF
jgi:hypothetical protein